VADRAWPAVRGAHIGGRAPAAPPATPRSKCSSA
jgi:hypothetical protein